MMTFVEACVKGKADISQIHDWIDKWHNEKLEISLHGYLGLSLVEYNKFVMDEKFLVTIVQSRKVADNV